MKKKFLPLFAFLFIALAACGPTNPSSQPEDPQPSSEQPSSEVPTSSEPDDPQFGDSSEQPSSETPSTEEPSSSETPSSQKEWVDYIYDSNVELLLEYEGKDFYADGVGEVELKTAIDGDTAHFYPVVKATSSETIKARFYGIDTPESTGQVQEWGRPASYFTKEKLLDAKTIVLSSPSKIYEPPQTDSTGGRYVTLIWVSEYENATIDQLVCLNLWIVQEGFSYVRNLSDIPEYVDTFIAAEDQAKAFKKNMFSGEADPYFNYGDYQDVSLLDIKREIEKQLEDPSYVNKYDNKKVRIVGTVAGFSNNILYLQNYYSFANGAPTMEGEYAGINIFVGASGCRTKFKTPNTYIQVCGLALDSETFGFQITDVSLPSYAYSENDGKILIKPEDNTDEYELHRFSYTANELSDVVDDNNYESLNCAVEITTEVEVIDAYQGDNDNFTLTLKGCSFDIYVSFLFIPYPEEKPSFIWNTEEQWIGAKLLVKGVYTYHKNSSRISYQVNPSNNSEIICMSPMVEE